ncbi:MAG: glycosyltransferase [Infirmifilum sp.]
MVDISFYGTVYNSAKYIERSLKSIVETALKLKCMCGLSSEIVIVDNYSDDGTWELMLKIREQYKEIPMKFVRYRSSRGLGRNIALHITEGRYLFFFSDFDIEYDPNVLTKIICNYIKENHLNDKCLYIFLAPRGKAIECGGIQNFNRAEDIEFGARLLKKNVLCYQL